MGKLASFSVAPRERQQQSEGDHVEVEHKTAGPEKPAQAKKPRAKRKSKQQRGKKREKLAL